MISILNVTAQLYCDTVSLAKTIEIDTRTIYIFGSFEYDKNIFVFILMIHLILRDIEMYWLLINVFWFGFIQKRWLARCGMCVHPLARILILISTVYKDDRVNCTIHLLSWSAFDAFTSNNISENSKSLFLPNYPTIENKQKWTHSGCCLLSCCGTYFVMYMAVRLVN